MEGICSLERPGTVATPTLFAPPPDHYIVSPFFVLQHSLPAVHLGSVYQLVIRLPCLHICSSSVWLRYCASASSVLPSILPAALRSHSSTLDGSFSPYVVFPMSPVTFVLIKCVCLSSKGRGSLLAVRKRGRGKGGAGR